MDDGNKTVTVCGVSMKVPSEWNEPTLIPRQSDDHWGEYIEGADVGYLDSNVRIISVVQGPARSLETWGELYDFHPVITKINGTDVIRLDSTLNGEKVKIKLYFIDSNGMIKKIIFIGGDDDMSLYEEIANSIQITAL